MNYGPLLRATRELRGLTQSQMGDALNIDRSVVAKMEQGKVGLMMERGLKWFHITESQKVLELLSTGVEISIIISGLTTLLGGFIRWI